MKSLSLSSVAVRSLRFFVRPNAAVGLGIAAATAVIVGALVVGDSVRGSLRGLVLDRLANVDCLLHTPTFFEPDLVDELSQPAAQIIPLIYLPRSTVEHSSADSVQRSGEIQIFGTDERFWRSIAPPADALQSGLKDDEIAVNQTLATELQAAVGDELTLRFARTSGVPPDSPLGHSDDTTTNLPRQKIVAILPDVGVGGLSFASSQSLPRNIFCNVVSLQDALDCGAKVNAAVALLNNPPQTAVDETPADTAGAHTPLAERAGAVPKPGVSTAVLGPQWCLQLNDQLRPTLEDYGLKLERITQRFPDAASSIPPATVTDPQDTNAEHNDDGRAAAGDELSEGSTETINDYYQLTSDQLILDNATVAAIDKRFDGSQAHLLAYLANTIAKIVPDTPATGDEPRDEMLSRPVTVAGRPVPYSIVVGVPDTLGQGTPNPLPDPSAELSAQELEYPYCWINSWLADELQASPQDWLEITYYEPETIDGREQQRQTRAIIAGIVPLTKPEQGFRRNRPAVYTSRPTIFNDPHLTPTVPGLTDKDSIANWNAPFKLDLDLIQPADDEYYDFYRLTPKLFLPYRAAAQPSMFGSRFGQTTSIRFPVDKFASESHLRQELESALLANRSLKGFQFEPIRQKLLKSATGTTPFDMLFLSLSFFVIVAALMLVVLLFRLGISQRATQLGLLAAQGFTAQRIRGLLLREMALVASAGSVLGIALGLGYAWAMIAALETWWVGAISAPFLSFSFTWSSLVIGAVAGLLISLSTLYISLRRISQQTPLRLLRGESEASVGSSHALRLSLLVIAAALALAAVGLMVAASGQSGMARAGSFFGSGMLLLMAGLLALHWTLQSRGNASRGAHREPRGSTTGASGLWGLAWRTIQRNPLRSSLALGLLSVASFLIASMSVFHVTPDPRGYGGFNLIAESSQPIFQDLASHTVRSQQLGTAAAPLQDAVIVSARMRPGQDASCNNLFQVEQPTILGIPSRLEQIADASGDQSTLGIFQWAVEPAGRWQALEAAATGTADDPIPVILDQNTAAWSLKQGASLGAPTVLQYGQRELHFRTVGLLANSVLQGKLLISEANFKSLFPELSGYRFFMIRSGQSASPADTTTTLEKGWSDAGLDVTSSQQTLQQLLGVQNTYISAFQSLGALGLLLGTFGLIAVQLRSVWERRRELALMQAVGFSKRRIAHLLTLETLLLLGGGLLLGSLAATIALVPYVLENGTRLSLLGPLVMLAGILLVGFVAALVAVRSALQTSVLSGLRAE